MVMKTLLEVQNIYNISVNWLGKYYQYNLLDIDYYKIENISINKETITINFSDLHNNCKYICQIFQSINSLLKQYEPLSYFVRYFIK